MAASTVGGTGVTQRPSFTSSTDLIAPDGDSTGGVTGGSVAVGAGATGNSQTAPDYTRGQGHFFTRKTFHRPTYCHHCTDMLWGLIGQGYVCEVCNFVVHDRCLRTVVSPCSSIATYTIKNPVAHCWSEPTSFKRKFCNLCRKRLDDSLAICCEICEYYAHVDCQDFVVNDCKECATYVPPKELVEGSQTHAASANNKSTPGSVIQYHHWREGNLSGNSKCLACKKTCWSAECLAGMRCEWCGVTAHATCYKILPEECSFGCLREILLPPYCLTVPRIDVPQETLFGFPKKPVTEDFSSSGGGDAKNDDDTDKQQRPTKDSGKDGGGSGTGKDRERDREREDEIVRIYDGNGSLKRRQYRTVSVPKQAPAQMLLEAALRTFHISEDPNNFTITEVADNEAGENSLDLTQPLHGQITARPGKRFSVFLRYKEVDATRGYICIYPKGLSDISPKADVMYKPIAVTVDDTVLDLIRLSLLKFGIENADAHDFQLVEVLLDKGVFEKKLSEEDKPWQIMQSNRRECLRQSRMTRFYLKQKEDPHGPHTSLFIGNLPTNCSQRQYEHILLDIVGRENKWERFDVIYYEYGSLVLIYNNAERASKSFNLLQEGSFDDKTFLVLLLPNILPHMIAKHITPLLVLVNVRSGGQQGMELIRSFRKLLNPHQVYDLMNGGPLPGLYVFRNIPYFRILVCGGDGSVGWALACLDNVGQDAQCQSPPMAVIPLGTGNDLARVLRWGPGYNGGEDPLNLLRDVVDAEEIKLDRWTVIFHPNEAECNDSKVAIANTTNTAQPSEDTTSIYVMNNYFGIGLDADLCLDFHMAREENPDKFNSRLHNKGVYFKIGLRKMMVRRSCKDLQRHIRLEVDGKLVDIPPVEGIIILNILSWASGSNPWGPEKEDQFSKPTHYDGMLEIVGVTGVVHMGQIQSGLRSATRIAQGGHIKIQMAVELPVQVDGEPWIQAAGHVVVLRSALKATMLKKSKNKMKRCNTEPSMYFPNDANFQSTTSAQMPLVVADGDSGPL